MPVPPVEDIVMITELLTPLVLAATPAIVEIDKTAKYDHEKQVVVAGLGGGCGLGGCRGTVAGTQTYGGDGRPVDNDSD